VIQINLIIQIHSSVPPSIFMCLFSSVSCLCTLTYVSWPRYRGAEWNFHEISK